MAKKQSGRTYISAGFSIDPETFELSKARAEKLRMGWSEYVRRCLELDISSDGDMVIKAVSPKQAAEKRQAVTR